MDNNFQFPPAQFLREDAVRGGMDLLLFAHKSHLRHSDAALAALGLGRAHHRCLYFVGRKPDLNVGELISLLGVRKQSMQRVINELLARNYVIQKVGRHDKRHRLLSLTPDGLELEKRLFSSLHENMSQAYVASGEQAVAGFWIMMQNLMNEEARSQFEDFQLVASCSLAKKSRLFLFFVCSDTMCGKLNF